MPWPQSRDYNEAVQNPSFSFEDADLRTAEAVTNVLGLPAPRSGNFADVYQLRSPDGRRSWAVKCFTRHIAGLQDRYREISVHLDRARLPFTVAFDYLERGVRIGGEWYPILKMDWIEGQTLNQFCQLNLDSPRVFDSLAALWLKLAQRLRQAQIAHADLQHGNVLLIPAKADNRLAMKLIDYDGMHVPALVGKPSGELGHPAYQHPQRLRENIYSIKVDRFSHLVIYCALRALAINGQDLWKRYDNGDNLLFTAQDFQTPGQSAVLKELWYQADPELHACVGHVILACAQQLGQVPFLDALVNGAKVQPLTVGQESEAAEIVGAEGKRPSAYLDRSPIVHETVELPTLPEILELEPVDSHRDRSGRNSTDVVASTPSASAIQPARGAESKAITPPAPITGPFADPNAPVFPSPEKVSTSVTRPSADPSDAVAHDLKAMTPPNAADRAERFAKSKGIDLDEESTTQFTDTAAQTAQVEKWKSQLPVVPIDYVPSGKVPGETQAFMMLGAVAGVLVGVAGLAAAIGLTFCIYASGMWLVRHVGWLLWVYGGPFSFFAGIFGPCAVGMAIGACINQIGVYGKCRNLPITVICSVVSTLGALIVTWYLYANHVQEGVHEWIDVGGKMSFAYDDFLAMLAFIFAPLVAGTFASEEFARFRYCEDCQIFMNPRDPKTLRLGELKAVVKAIGQGEMQTAGDIIESATGTPSFGALTLYLCPDCAKGCVEVKSAFTCEIPTTAGGTQKTTSIQSWPVASKMLSEAQAKALTR